MYGIMLVNQAGETVASVGWEHLKGDVSMFGGFVSAVQMFIKKVSGGTEVEELRFGDMKMLIGNADPYHIVTLHEADESNAMSENREVVKLIGDNGGAINNGLLDLIKELVSRNGEATELVTKSVKDWTESQVDRAKKSASDWGKTVF
ncbi:MAG: hypothetical protein ACXABL_15020 [Candidatus Thorarchaeota archaeon]|jgi:hypothetical protein